MAQTRSIDAVDPAMAISANDPDAVPSLLKEISTLGEGFTCDNAENRLGLLAKARALCMALETPRETMLWQGWANASNIHFLTDKATLTHKGVFSYLAQQHAGPFKAAEVGQATGVDPLLMSRLMRHLGAMGHLKEVGADTYELTNFARAMALPSMACSYSSISGGSMPALTKFHWYADKINWTTPTNKLDCPFQYGHNTKLDYFSWMQENPPYAEHFGHHMRAYSQGRVSWIDPTVYPVRGRIIDGFESGPDAALLVDVGGSIGHDLELFHKAYPDAPGRLVLQDLPAVIGRIAQLDEKIEPMSHDFFTEQPIKGARAYYVHSVLHDWSDEDCLRILSNITAAMRPGYSKLLVNENLIPDRSAPWAATALDLILMTLMGARERTRDDWVELLARAGLRVVKIWGVESAVERLIECELA